MSNEVIDVTVPIQCLVKDSKLVIHDRTKVLKLKENKKKNTLCFYF